MEQGRDDTIRELLRSWILITHFTRIGECREEGRSKRAVRFSGTQASAECVLMDEENERYSCMQ